MCDGLSVLRRRGSLNMFLMTGADKRGVSCDIWLFFSCFHSRWHLAGRVVAFAFFLSSLFFFFRVAVVALAGVADVLMLRRKGTTKRSSYVILEVCS